MPSLFTLSSTVKKLALTPPKEIKPADIQELARAVQELHEYLRSAENASRTSLRSRRPE